MVLLLLGIVEDSYLFHEGRRIVWLLGTNGMKRTSGWGLKGGGTSSDFEKKGTNSDSTIFRLKIGGLPQLVKTYTGIHSWSVYDYL